MRTLAGSIVGILAATGIWIAVAGWRGVAVVPRRRGMTVSYDLWWRACIVAAAAIAAWSVTGWPAAGAIVGAAAGVIPQLFGIGRRRKELNQRTEALASWAEMLRDSISSHAGLREAISVTARVAPIPIRSEVQELAVRAEREPLPDALRRFGSQVDDPLADLIVAAMIIAAERQAQRLADLLTQIASAARDMSGMRLRVETGRARTYTSSKVLVMFTFGLAVTLLLFAPEFMRPFDTAMGQVVMVGIGGLFCAALWSLVVLGRPATTPRLFAPVDGRSS
jgi:tight adherence protein B